MISPQPPDSRQQASSGDDRRPDRRWKNTYSDTTRIDTRQSNSRDFRRTSAPASPFPGFHRRDDRVYKDRRWSERKKWPPRPPGPRLQDHRNFSPSNDSNVIEDDNFRKMTQRPSSPGSPESERSGSIPLDVFSHSPRNQYSNRNSYSPHRPSPPPRQQYQHGQYPHQQPYQPKPKPHQVFARSTENGLFKKRDPDFKARNADNRYKLADRAPEPGHSEPSHARHASSAIHSDSEDDLEIEPSPRELKLKVDKDEKIIEKPGAVPDLNLNKNTATAYESKTKDVPAPKRKDSNPGLMNTTEDANMVDKSPLMRNSVDPVKISKSAAIEPPEKTLDSGKEENQSHESVSKKPELLKHDDSDKIAKRSKPVEKEVVEEVQTQEVDETDNVPKPRKPEAQDIPQMSPEVPRKDIQETLYDHLKDVQPDAQDDMQVEDESSSVQKGTDNADKMEGVQESDSIEIRNSPAPQSPLTRNHEFSTPEPHSEPHLEATEPLESLDRNNKTNKSGSHVFSEAKNLTPAAKDPEDDLPQVIALHKELDQRLNVLIAECPPKQERVVKRWTIAPLDLRAAYLLRTKKYRLTKEAEKRQSDFNEQKQEWLKFVEGLETIAAEDAAATIKANEKAMQATVNTQRNKRDSESYGRRNHRGHGFGDVARSEAEFMEILASLEEQTARDPLVRARLTSAQIYDQQPVPDGLFISDNCKVVDKSSLLTRLRSYEIDDFTDEQHQLFEMAYLKTPKEFGKIAQIVGRNFNDCVMHYYRTKKEVGYKAMLLATGRKKRGRKPKKRPESAGTQSPATPATPVTPVTPVTSSSRNLESSTNSTPVRSLTASPLHPNDETQPKPASLPILATSEALDESNMSIEMASASNISKSSNSSSRNSSNPRISPVLPVRPPHEQPTSTPAPLSDPASAPLDASKVSVKETSTETSSNNTRAEEDPSNVNPSESQSAFTTSSQSDNYVPPVVVPILEEHKHQQTDSRPSVPAQSDQLEHTRQYHSSAGDQSDSTILVYPSGDCSADRTFEAHSPQPMDALAVAALVQPVLAPISWTPNDVAVLDHLVTVYGSNLPEIAHHMNRPLEIIRDFLYKNQQRYSKVLSNLEASFETGSAPQEQPIPAYGPQIGVFSPRTEKTSNLGIHSPAFDTPRRLGSTVPTTPQVMVSPTILGKVSQPPLFSPLPLSSLRAPTVPLPLIPQKPVYNCTVFGSFLTPYSERFEESNERSRSRY